MNYKLSVTREAARRYILGSQGLWAGRRWNDVVSAIAVMGTLQLDPLTIVARSQDLVLRHRVEGYRPRDLAAELFEKRTLFEYGGVLSAIPINELPYWRYHMMRRQQDLKYAEAIPDINLRKSILGAINSHGPMSSRAIRAHVSDDAPKHSRAKMSGSYRNQSVVGKSLYQLWLGGDLMTSDRVGFERVYDLPERVAPSTLLHAATYKQAQEFFLRTILRRGTFGTLASVRSSLSYLLHQPVGLEDVKPTIDAAIASGEVAEVTVAGVKGTRFLPSGSAQVLEILNDGELPDGWIPESRVFALSPLDPVVKNDPARKFFDFEQIWGIYKPAHKRKWGPFTMPLVFGDEIVGRADMRDDVATSTLHINGIWIEHEVAKEFAEALSVELHRLREFVGATTIDVHSVVPRSLGTTL